MVTLAKLSASSLPCSSLWALTHPNETALGPSLDCRSLISSIAILRSQVLAFPVRPATFPAAIATCDSERINTLECLGTSLSAPLTKHPSLSYTVAILPSVTPLSLFPPSTYQPPPTIPSSFKLPSLYIPIAS